jgi:hypothetical protein
MPFSYYRHERGHDQWWREIAVHGPACKIRGHGSQRHPAQLGMRPAHKDAETRYVALPVIATNMMSANFTGTFTNLRMHRHVIIDFLPLSRVRATGGGKHWRALRSPAWTTDMDESTWLQDEHRWSRSVCLRPLSRSGKVQSPFWTNESDRVMIAIPHYTPEAKRNCYAVYHQKHLPRGYFARSDCPLWAVFLNTDPTWLTIAWLSHSLTPFLFSQCFQWPWIAVSLLPSTLFLAHVISCTLKMEATLSPETSVYNKSTRRYFPDDGILQQSSCYVTSRSLVEFHQRFGGA